MPVDIETTRNDDPVLVALVERIEATPPNPAAIQPIIASLAELLKDSQQNWL